MGGVGIELGRRDVDVRAIDRHHRAVGGGQLIVDRERRVQRGEIPAVFGSESLETATSMSLIVALDAPYSMITM
jgi:hypothetical protein